MAVKRYNGTSWDTVAGVGAQGAAGTNGTDASPYAAGKNKIINGDMAIAQRGISISVGSASYTYTLDRFKTFSANTATTVSRDTSAPTGFSYSYKLQRPNANTGTNSLSVIQIIETQNVMSLQGQTATISFYIKKGANYSGGNITVQGLTGTGTDQGGDPYSFTGLGTFVNDSSYSPTTSFVRVNYTGTIASSVKEIALVIAYTPTGTAGADDAIYVTGIQLEAGSVATAFQTATGTIQGELAACLYYFNRLAGEGTGHQISNGQCWSSTEAMATINYPTMRVAPTITYSTNSWFSLQNATNTEVAITALASYNIRKNSYKPNMTVASGLVAGNATLFQTRSTGSTGTLDLSAEL
jgi:uncharacterized protein (DUF486 family)